MRAEALIDLSAIKHNVELLKAKSRTNLLAVVKADAYGHGLIPVAGAALKAGASYLGVALLEEAITLRQSGISAPILAWLVQPGSDFAAAIELDIELAVASLLALEEVSAASEKVGKRAKIHLEVDTGMSRGGFLDEWHSLTTEHLARVEVVGIFSHFARADEPEQPENLAQLKRFEEMVAHLASLGHEKVIRHLSNSAATLVNGAAAFDMVRAGIAMYGLTPDRENLGSSSSLKLRPAMQLRAALYLVKDVAADSGVGYGATERTSAQTKLGVITMGYADGIPRIARTAGAWCNGARAPIIGRISMDQFVVDLGAQSPAKSGDWVVIFGNGSHGEYTADDWGASSQSINYEIVTRIGPRVPRIYAPHVY